MKIDIAHIAKLSRLHIEPEKMDKFEKDMAAIVDMVDRLPDVEDELTLDAEHPMKLREDVAVEHKFRREKCWQMHQWYSLAVWLFRKR